MGLSELQKGFGAALLRQASPEGKLIAELQQASREGAQLRAVTLSSAQLKGLAGHGTFEVLPPPGAAAWYELGRVTSLFLPGSDVDSDPLLQGSGNGFDLGYGPPTGAAPPAKCLFVANLSGVPHFLQNSGHASTLNLHDTDLSLLLGQPVVLSSDTIDGTETITGNAAGDARLHLHLTYWLHTLDL